MHARGGHDDDAAPGRVRSPPEVEVGPDVAEAALPPAEVGEQVTLDEGAGQRHGEDVAQPVVLTLIGLTRRRSRQEPTTAGGADRQALKEVRVLGVDVLRAEDAGGRRTPPVVDEGDEGAGLGSGADGQEPGQGRGVGLVEQGSVDDGAYRGPLVAGGDRDGHAVAAAGLVDDLADGPGRGRPGGRAVKDEHGIRQERLLENCREELGQPAGVAAGDDHCGHRRLGTVRGEGVGRACRGARGGQGHAVWRDGPSRREDGLRGPLVTPRAS